MAQYIDKSALVEEIERLKTIYKDDENIRHVAKYNILVDILSFINTLEVKDILKDIDVDLNPFFEELGVGFDSRIAYTLKETFYKGIDRYLNKKENNPYKE